MDNVISEQSVINTIHKTIYSFFDVVEEPMNEKDKLLLRVNKAICNEIKKLPPAQSEIAEKLSMYKCYVTDENGLQHEVIHTGDIRRITGWII